MKIPFLNKIKKSQNMICKKCKTKMFVKNTINEKRKNCTFVKTEWICKKCEALYSIGEINYAKN